MYTRRQRANKLHPVIVDGVQYYDEHFENYEAVELANDILDDIQYQETMRNEEVAENRASNKPAGPFVELDDAVVKFWEKMPSGENTGALKACLEDNTPTQAEIEAEIGQYEWKAEKGV